MHKLFIFVMATLILSVVAWPFRLGTRPRSSSFGLGFGHQTGAGLGFGQQAITGQSFGQRAGLGGWNFGSLQSWVRTAPKAPKGRISGEYGHEYNS